MFKIKRYLQLSLTEKKLFLEALFFLYIAWLMTLFFPFKTCLKRVKRKGTIENVDPEKLKKISIALDRANYLNSWKNECLVSSFAGRWMLNSRNIYSVLYIGALNDKGEFKAHAWLISCGREIVRKGEDYVILFSI
jgi:hypothetical protein